MKLYMRDGVIVAIHEDSQAVPADAYGEGIEIVDHQGSLAGLPTIWDAPAEPDQQSED